MIRIAIIFLTYISGFLAAVFGIFLGLPFTTKQREKYSILKKKNLVAITIPCLFVSCVANISKDILTTKPSTEAIQSPGGEIIQKATLTGIKKELKEAAEEQVKEHMKNAEDYFNAAERDFEAKEYQDAATYYQKSINVLPTMSAYLNLGLSLYYISDFQKADNAFYSGMQIAQKKKNKELEGAFLGNIGIVYRNQGKLDEALEYHQQALKIHKQIGNPLGQANQLGNIGIVYADQGKNQEALKLMNQARDVFQKIGARIQLQIVEEKIRQLSKH